MSEEYQEAIRAWNRNLREQQLASQQAGQHSQHSFIAPYTPMVQLMMGVREGLPRCEVYFKIVDGPEPTFKLEVLALAQVNDQYFATTMRTADVSVGISDTRLKDEIALLVNGVANMLAAASFRGHKEPIPPVALKIFVEPA